MNWVFGAPLLKGRSGAFTSKAKKKKEKKKPQPRPNNPPTQPGLNNTPPTHPHTHTHHPTNLGPKKLQKNNQVLKGGGKKKPTFWGPTNKTPKQLLSTPKIPA